VSQIRDTNILHRLPKSSTSGQLKISQKNFFAKLNIEENSRKSGEKIFLIFLPFNKLMLHRPAKTRQHFSLIFLP
jgi:hypothetical protein